MAVTYYVALPFVRTEERAAAGQAQEMPNESAAIRRAESMSRDPANAGALVVVTQREIGDFFQVLRIQFHVRSKSSNR